MNIIPPASPTFAIQIVDADGIPIGVLDQNHKATEARRLLHRIRDSFPNSTLVTYDDCRWVTVDDEQLTSAIYLHTMYVMAELTRAGLPMAFWQLAPYQADKLEGKLHIADVGEARKAIEVYADAFGVAEVMERETDHATYLELGEVVWAGARIELSTYSAKRKQPETVTV